jgi:hypothetical protein
MSAARPGCGRRTGTCSPLIEQINNDQVPVETALPRNRISRPIDEVLRDPFAGLMPTPSGLTR